MRRHLSLRLRPIAGLGALALCACGSSTTPGSDIGGTCGNRPSAGPMCNSLTNVASPIVPTCKTGSVPTGTGGTPADGTYVLTAQTYYNVGGCDSPPIAATFALAGNCLQLAARAEVAGDGGLVTFSGTGMVTQQSNEMTVDLTCASVAGAVADASVRTFTATGSTLTWFILNSAYGNPNPDRVEVYERQ
jgi:hypothetical protein